MAEERPGTSDKPDANTLFLCGDVMTGRGVDQILPHPGDPRLFEPHVHSASGYVELAETVSGRIDRPVAFSYIWGDALLELERVRPDARIVNLETAVTDQGQPWPDKGIHYRMHPANAPCLTAAKLDCCVLANNHAMDFGREGLVETLETLTGAGIHTAGAGKTAAEASEPAAVSLPNGRRALVFAFAAESSGVPSAWRARGTIPGVNLLRDVSLRSVESIADRIGLYRHDRDLVIVSLHWGPNWGFDVSREERRFAHALIEAAGVDVVHGHSSHHVKGIEVYQGKPILYGCGDFINDYEGIGGYAAYRGDLSLMYFPTFDAQGQLTEFLLTPMCMRQFRAHYARASDAEWLCKTLNREGRKWNTRAEQRPDRTLRMHWD